MDEREPEGSGKKDTLYHWNSEIACRGLQKKWVLNFQGQKRDSVEQEVG